MRKLNLETNLIGKQFGRWTVLSFDRVKNKSNLYFICKCSCGTNRSVAYSSLSTGISKSCGCLLKEIVSSLFKTHGKRLSPEYNTWCKMKSRCYKEYDNNYKNYGAKGIKICKRWLNSFENFYKDMGDKPSPKHSIERINNKRGYYPKNCKWATRKEQNRNQSTTLRLTIDGVTKAVHDWCEIYNISINTYKSRRLRKWSKIKSLTHPKKVNKYAYATT